MQFARLVPTTTLLLACIGLVSPAESAVVFSDNFQSLDTDATDNTADGDGVSGTDGYDTTLSSGAPVNGPYFTAVNDDKLGNAGRLTDGAGSNQQFSFVAASFASQTLANVGDQLTLNFDFSIDNIASNGSALRFGFWNATGGIDTDAGQNYWAKVSTSTSAGSSTALFEDSDGFPGTNFGTLTTDGSGAIVTDDSRVSAEFSLTRTINGIDVAVEFRNTNDLSLIEAVSFEDTTPVSTTFNAIGFRHGSVTMDTNIDNIVVVFDGAGATIPEPASLALLGLGGLLAIGGRRRRVA